MCAGASLFGSVGQDFFRVNPLGYGATYQAHPVALACGYEVVKYTIAEDIVGKVHALEPVLKEEMQRYARTAFTACAASTLSCRRTRKNDAWCQSVDRPPGISLVLLADPLPVM